MSTAWLPYLPEHLARAIAARPTTLQIGRARRVHAVALFADVSGFTPMSEALARTGRRGAEDLTLILNRYFTRMIALLHDYGGIVCKFGGDALTVIFPYHLRVRGSVTRRAVTCAHAMQAAMTEYAAIPTNAGTFGLAMKIGIARGSLLSMTAGDTDRLEYILAGGPLDRCADAEHHADKGEIVVDDQLLDDLGALAGVEQRNGFSCIGRMLRPARPVPMRPLPEISTAAAAVYTRYLHPAIAQRIAAGQAGFINEHRQVSVLFVNFSGFDYDDDPQAGARLQSYLHKVFAVVRRYDGSVNLVDMGDKGSKYIVLFGAPIAHEDDSARAVSCALELLELPVAARVGVTTGFVYCGLVGAPDRQTYTVMGDAVNLAARLMQAAQPGQLLAATATWESTARMFDWAALEPLLVKGKRDPVAVYSAQQATNTSTQIDGAAARPMLGRTGEINRILGALELAASGRGQIIAVRGETGIGKSRLLAEISARALVNYEMYSGSCQSYGGSYQAWRAIWQSFFGIDPVADGAIRRAALESKLAGLAPHLLLRAPLLALPLQIPFPDNDVTRTLDPQLRDQLLKSLLVACVRAAARRSPILIVLDDCHWIDPLSRELLELIGRSLVDLPVVLLLAARPHVEGVDPLAWLEQLDHARSLSLSELPHPDAVALIKSSWSQRFGPPDPSDDMVAHLIARAQGNPLYLEELIAYMQVPGAMPGQHLTLDLPDTLQQLILSRIDRLDTPVQATLKAASVIGAQVPTRWLAEGYPQLGGSTIVPQQLDTLRRMELLALERAAPDPEYRFHHTLLRDTAYESLAFATRASLHEQLGDYIEQRYAGELDAQTDALAYHYGRTDNATKQRVYFRRAGDLARAAYANSAAVEYYQRLLPLLDPAEQASVLHALGEVWRFTGERQRAEEACHQALALAEAAGDRRIVADCACTLGAVVGRTQSYDAALPWLEQALAIYEAIGDQSGLSRVLELLSFTHYQLGNTRQALADAERQLDVASAINDHIGRSDALAQIGSVAVRLSEFERALGALRQALEIATAIGYRRRMVLASNTIAGIYWRLNNFTHALEWLLRASADAEEIGYVWVLGLMIGNAGMIYAQHGADDQALACYARALQIALDLGDRPGIVPSLTQTAALFAAQTHDDQALSTCARAITLARELSLPYELCEALELRANLLLRRADYLDAMAACVEVRALAERIEEVEIVDRMRVFELRLRVATAELTVGMACAALGALLDAAPDDTARAPILLAIWQIDPQRTDARVAAAAVYRQRYATAPSAELRRHYRTLTGDDLPPAPPLPALPAALIGTLGPLADLLAR
ncbi:MAG: adenylate/guanylate cyclase domain-containing protein, partial [Roseiflexaceae bacterium]